ncbi:Uncharacterised protein [uncultured archaeon]|nr:Uncharacterised protein [uncultured archaeon]
MNVELVKFPEFDEVDEKLFESALSHFFKKVGEDAKLHLDLKQYKKGGLRIQHEVHGTLSIRGKKFFASNEDWILINTLQSVLDKLAKEVKKADSKKD